MKKFKTAIRDSALLRVMQDLTAPLTRQIPLESMPGWLALIHGISAPNRVVPHAEPSPTGAANINVILGLLKRVMQLDGDLAECGVFRGSTLIPVGLYMAQCKMDKKLYGFDSFEGFGDLDRGGFVEDAYIQEHGDLNDTSYDMVQKLINRFGLSDRIVVIKGFFENTLHHVASKRFCFVHLDVDLYESYSTCLHFFYERMVPGGIILLDEYNDPPWPGCNRAVDEFLADKPETITEHAVDNYIKYSICKT